MKATGIVRRIDDLGRVVIPKEIRKTMRIREGDPLEIYTDATGGVIFKKYSQMEGDIELIRQLCEALHKVTGAGCAICDREHIVAACGMGKVDIVDKKMSPKAEEALSGRMSGALASPIELVEGENTGKANIAMCIISEGDVVGAVFSEAGKEELKSIQIASLFLSKYFE